MGSNSDLQFLSERAWDLVNKVNDEIIGRESVSFCKLCSENGHLCGIVAETPSWEDREGLVAIRDSLIDVQHILEFVQKLQSSQKGHQLLALAKLEESRMTLIGKVNEYNAKNGRKLKVIDEINAQFDKELENTNDEDLKIKRNKSWNCIRSFFNPWLVIKFIVISISISSSYKFYNGGRLEYKKFEGEEQQRLVWPLDLVKGRKHGFGLVDPNIPLDVLHGRG